MYGYTSPDGTHWSPTSNTLFTGLPKKVYVGLVTSSGDPAVTNTAMFDHVAIGTASSSLPAEPTSVRAKVSAGAVTVSWTAPATRNTVLRSTSRDGTYTAVTTGLRGRTYKDSTAATGTMYYYVVRGAGYGGLSPASAKASVTAP